MKQLAPCIAALSVALTTPALAQESLAAQGFAAPSAYGCSNLTEDNLTPILEGEDGIFYRIYADIRLQHPFSDRAVALMGELAEALRARGTTLVYLAVPTKSQAMPDQLPELAKLYGFSIEEATGVYRSVVDRLEAAGVVAVDGQKALLAAEPGAPPFFGTDFHWNAEGARLMAVEIADVLRGLDGYDALDKTSYETTEAGMARAFSGLRRQIQKKCVDEIPQAETMTYETVQQAGASLGAADLFGNAETRAQVVIAGTSFADMEIAHFEGWLAQYSELEVFNYAITGGNQFGAMLSYLTSDDFRDDPPHYLIWENPIYNNLLQYGEQPMHELISAAGDNCTLPLAADRADATSLSVDLSGWKTIDGDVIHAAAGAEGPRKVTFTAHLADGSTRSNFIERGTRLRATGHFYMPLSGFGTQGITRLDVTFDRAVPDSAALTLCRQSKESL